MQEAHEQIIASRYPWYHRCVREAQADTQSALALALERARSALLGRSIAIDATCVNGLTTGTQVLTLELAKALCEVREPNMRLALIINDQVSTAALLGVDQMVDEVFRVSALRNFTTPPFDLVHRPYQISSDAELNFLKKVASRLIVTHLDCIAYANPAYQASDEGWQNYRLLTQRVFNTVDGIAYISCDALYDAAHQGLALPQNRTCVTYAGVDHSLHRSEKKTRPSTLDINDRPFILVIGTNFKHKNRAYAIRLFRELVNTYQWAGDLILAGPAVICGSSGPEEALELLQCSDLRSRIHFLGSVTEAEKDWLLHHAALVLYPSSYEGFGFVPFEAAETGTPVLMERVTALAEVLGNDVLYLDTANMRLSLDVIWRMLSDRTIAGKQIEAINTQAHLFTWHKTARLTWQFYQTIFTMSPRSSNERVFVSDQKTEDAPLLTEKPIQAWSRRIRKGVRIFRREGIVPLRNEIKQYLKWRLG
jgi:glycosyltransferase involved in cell wall biosynthesis